MRSHSSIHRNRRRFYSHGRRTNAHLLAQFRVDAREHVLVLLQEATHILAALPDALALEAVPGAALVHDAVGHGQVQRIALARDAFAVQNVELGVAERRGHLVLHDLYLGPRPDTDIALFYRANPANVDAHRRVELQRLAAGRGLRVAEHDADLLADLVNKDEGGARLRHRTGQLAQGLAHQPRLQTHLRLAHLAVELSLGHQCGDRIDDQDVDRARPHQRLHNLQRLL